MAPPAVVNEEAISNPPGVKMMPSPIQNPPKLESAVPAKVFPIAISLFHTSQPKLFPRGHTESHLPHAGERLDETTIRECRSDDDSRMVCEVTCAEVDARQHECAQREPAETEWRRVGDVGRRPFVQTWLECAAKGRETFRLIAVGVGMRQRVAYVEEVASVCASCVLSCWETAMLTTIIVSSSLHLYLILAVVGLVAEVVVVDHLGLLALSAGHGGQRGGGSGGHCGGNECVSRRLLRLHWCSLGGLMGAGPMTNPTFFHIIPKLSANTPSHLI